MGDKIIPDGTYVVMGAGGQLAMLTKSTGSGSIMLVQPDRSDKTQQWAVKFSSGSYTLQNVATRSYLGNDDDPGSPAMTLSGAEKPVGWELADGPDGDPNSYLLTSAASSGALMLAPSPLPLFPPQLAILPPRREYPYEWIFAKVGLSAAGPREGGNCHARTNQAADRRGPAGQRADHPGAGAKGGSGRRLPHAQ
jgi:hypothetical protein